MLKFDGCYANASIYDAGYPNMTKALNATGRPIVFSCSWPAYLSNVRIFHHTHTHSLFLLLQPNYTVISENCNLWRNYDDIQVMNPSTHNNICTHFNITLPVSHSHTSIISYFHTFSLILFQVFSTSL